MRRLLALVLLVVLFAAYRSGRLGRISSLWKTSYGMTQERPLGEFSVLDSSFVDETHLRRVSPQYFHMGPVPGQGGDQTYPPEFRPEGLGPGLSLYEYVDEGTVDHEVPQCVRLVVGPQGKVAAILGYVAWTGSGPSAPMYRTKVGRLMLELWNEAVSGPASFVSESGGLLRARVEGERVSAEWIMSRPSYEKIFLKSRGR